MKRSINILSFLIILIILSSSIFTAIDLPADTDTAPEEETIATPAETPTDSNTELTEEEKLALQTIQETSDAGTEFIIETSKATWPKLKEIIANPINATKEMQSWTKSKLSRVIGVTNKDGENIWLLYYFFGENEGWIFMLIGIFLFISFIIIVYANTQLPIAPDKDSFKKILRNFAILLVLTTAIISAINKTPFWKDFAFLVIVWIFTFIIFWITYENRILQKRMGTITNKEYLRIPITVAIFSIIYIILSSIPVLNLGIYIITLEFLGLINPIFAYVIRPLIITLILFFSGDILTAHSKSKEKEKKLQDALEKQAIKEMGKASLRA